MKAHEYWFSRYGVRRNPGIFFMSFCTSKNNFKKFLKSCSILSLPIQSICSFFFSFFGEFFFEIFFTIIVEYNGCIIQKFFLPY